MTTYPITYDELYHNNLYYNLQQILRTILVLPLSPFLAELDPVCFFNFFGFSYTSYLPYFTICSASAAAAGEMIFS